MHKFILLLSLLFFSLNLSCSASEFNENEAWEEMHYQASSRAQELREITLVLSNKEFDLKQRVAAAQKILPTDLSLISMPSSRPSASTKHLQNIKFVNAILSDVTYTLLYWDFLERTLTFYLKEPNNTPEIRKAVLPHLNSEFKNFELYASEDLKINTSNKYYSWEFFLTKALIEESNILGHHYGVQTQSPAQFVDAKTNEPINLTSEIAEDFTITSEKKTSQAKDKEKYFMEQLMFFRKRQLDHAVPDLKSPLLQAFQTYILLPSGPVSIPETVQTNTVIEELPAPIKKAPLPVKPKTGGIDKKSKTSKANRKRQHRKVGKALSLSQGIGSPSSSPVGSPSKQPLTPEEEDLKISIDTTASSSTTAPSITLTPLMPTITIAAALHAPSQTLSLSPVSLPRPLQRLNIRDLRLHLEYRTTTDYCDPTGNPYSSPFFKKSLKHFEPNFLKTIKQMIHLSPQTSKLPNLVQMLVTFHYLVAEQMKTRTFIFEELFLNGGKFFGRSDQTFKTNYNIVDAFDLLSSQDRDTIFKCEMGRKGIPLGIALEKDLRKKVVGGPWKSNCLDSEAIALLWLTKKFPSILDTLVAENGSKDITLTGFILGISSYRDCCPNCQKLIQGFQHNLRATLEEHKKRSIGFDRDFATLAITYGRTRHVGKYPQESSPPIFTKEAARLTPNQHKFVCVQNDFL